MKLRIPLYCVCACLLTIFSDKLLIHWIHNSIMKSILYGLLVGFSFFLIEKSGAANRQRSKPIGIFMILVSFSLIVFSNHFV